MQRKGSPADAAGSAEPGRRRTRSDRARQVADVLRQQVAHGAEGDLLPDERILQREFDVSRNTVREALDALRREGLVSRLPGIGTVITSIKHSHILDSITGLGESLSQHGTVTNEVRVAARIGPPREVAARLELAPDAEVIYIERLRRLDEMPISFDQAYFPLDVGGPLLDCDLQTRDLFELVQSTSGHQLVTAEIAVESVSADEHSAALLNVRPGSALLVLRRRTLFADGRPADVEFLRLRGDRMIMNLTPQVIATRHLGD